MKLIVVTHDGSTSKFLDADLNVKELGVVVKERASYIYPLDMGRRWLFHFFRLLFGDSGKVADWTRRWKCVWICELADGSDWKVSDSREDLVDWEHKQLNMKG